jgi:hypothetical protein
MHLQIAQKLLHRKLQLSFLCYRICNVKVKKTKTKNKKKNYSNIAVTLRCSYIGKKGIVGGVCPHSHSFVSANGF